MTDSSVGLMTSNVAPSLLLTNSLLMKLVYSCVVSWGSLALEACTGTRASIDLGSSIGAKTETKS